ncbi:SoxR reducing system RseC family protein [Halopseudomonas pachastrellae]|nr:SoxR reducing system RseC family protein [Halopseudomonas pachastrellae]
MRSSTCATVPPRQVAARSCCSGWVAAVAAVFVRALTDRQWQVGDEVVIGVPEDALVRGALWVYMMPLLALFVVALSAQALGGSEPQVILAALWPGVWFCSGSLARPAG